MPYVKREIRDKLYVLGNEEGDLFPSNAGELNYVLTNIAIDYAQGKGRSYATYNEIVGVLECMKLEFYRRAVAPYEDMKILENGDVYS